MPDTTDDAGTTAPVEHLASLVALSIDPADRPAVAEHLARLLSAAALVMEFPLPENAGPASVFHP